VSLEEPKFLTLAEVLYLHEESLVRFGGSAGIREPGLVESALGSAQNAFGYGRGGLFEIAAAYAFHLAESQAFIDWQQTNCCRCCHFVFKKEWHPMPKR